MVKESKKKEIPVVEKRITHMRIGSFTLSGGRFHVLVEWLLEDGTQNSVQQISLDPDVLEIKIKSEDIDKTLGEMLEDVFLQAAFDAKDKPCLVGSNRTR